MSASLCCVCIHSAMLKKPVVTEVRTPTNTWSGLGFSKSMPAETIKELRRANHVSYKPSMTTTYEVRHNEGSLFATVSSVIVQNTALTIWIVFPRIAHCPCLDPAVANVWGTAVTRTTGGRETALATAWQVTQSSPRRSAAPRGNRTNPVGLVGLCSSLDHQRQYSSTSLTNGTSLFQTQVINWTQWKKTLSAVCRGWVTDQTKFKCD